MKKFEVQETDKKMSNDSRLNKAEIIIFCKIKNKKNTKSINTNLQIVFV